MATTFLEPGTDATQDLSLWDSTAIPGSTTLATATDQAHVGTRSLKVTNTASSANAYALASGVLADAGFRASFWVRFNSVAPSADTMFARASATGVISVLGLGLDTTGKLRIGGKGATSQVGATVLSANTWYRLTWTAVITTATSWTMKLFLNGTLEITSTNVDGTLGTVGVNEFSLGIMNSGSFDDWASVANTINIWFDSIYIDNAATLDDPGAIDVTAKRPFSNGTAVQFITQIGAGGSGYGTGHAPQVNEQPLSVTNGWSLSNTTVQTEEYSVEGAAVGDVDVSAATIKDYMGWIYAKVNSTANSPVHHIIVGGAATAVVLGTTATIFRAAKGSTSYPAGNTDIGMDAQFTTTAHLTSLFECGILVAYVPGVVAGDTQEWRGCFPPQKRTTWPSATY